VQYSPAFADRLAKISSKDSYAEIVESLLGLLGRSSPEKSEKAKDAISTAETVQPKPNAIAYAWYETIGENSVRAQAYIRPSTRQEGYFTFENSFREEEEGTKEEIATRLVMFDKKLRLSNYRRTHDMTADPALRVS
jgi:hypothetical protein